MLLIQLQYTGNYQGEMEATPIISPPAKKASLVRQLDLRITKTPNGKKGATFAVCTIRVYRLFRCL